MKKFIALLIVAVFIVVGCDSSTPSTGLVKETLIKAFPNPPEDGAEWYATGFSRINGHAIKLSRGEDAYQVEGKVLKKAKNGLVRVNGKEFADVNATYESNISLIFVKTENGWEPKAINRLHISYYPGFKHLDK